MISIRPKFYRSYLQLRLTPPLIMVLVESKQKNYGQQRVKYLFIVARKLSVRKAAYELQMR